MLNCDLVGFIAPASIAGAQLCRAFVHEAAAALEPRRAFRGLFLVQECCVIRKAVEHVPGGAVRLRARAVGGTRASVDTAQAGSGHVFTLPSGARQPGAQKVVRVSPEQDKP